MHQIFRTLRTFRTLALAVLLPCLSWAAGNFTIGGGLNSSFTDVSDGSGVDYSNRVGFNAGLGFEVPIRPGLWIVPELNLGMMVHEVERVAAGRAKVHPLSRYDSELITPAQLLSFITEVHNVRHR